VTFTLLRAWVSRGENSGPTQMKAEMGKSS
jgi:hypothetical protein